MLKPFQPFFGIVLTVIVGAVIFKCFAPATALEGTAGGAFGFLPNLASRTNAQPSALTTGQASTNQAVTNTKSFHQLAVFIDANGRVRLRPEKLIEARLRVSLQAVSLAFIIAALVAWVMAGTLIWKMRRDDPPKHITFISFFLPACVAAAMAWWYSHKLELYLPFTVAIHDALQTIAEALPKLDWLVFCHGVGLGCALVFGSVSAWIIAQAEWKEDLKDAPSGSSKKVILSSYLDSILYMGAAVLALSVVFEISFYDWLAVYYLADSAQHEAFKSLTAAFLVAIGLSGTLFIASYYVPAALALKRIAGASAIDPFTKLKKVFAVISPLLVGSLPKIMELLGSLGG